MSDPPLDSAFRSAYQSLLDDAPQAPDWEDLAVPVYRPAVRAPKRLPRWAGALVVTIVLVGAVGGAAWLFSGNGDEPAPSGTVSDVSTPAAPEPATTSPATTAATQPSTTVTTLPLTAASTVPTSPDGTPVARELIPGPDRVFASSSLDGFPPEAVLDRDLTTAWQDDSLRGDGAELTFEFDEPAQLEGMILMNLDQEERFTRNYRVAAYEIVINGNTAAPIRGELADARGELLIPIERTVRSLVFKVTAVHEAEPFENDPPFNELAIAEVRFLGYPPVKVLPPASTGGLVEALAREPVRLALEDDVIATDLEWTGVFYYLSGSTGPRAALWASRDGTTWGTGVIPVRGDEIIVDLSTHSDVVLAVTSQTGTIEGGGGGIWGSSDGIRWQRLTTLPGPIGSPVEYAAGHLVAPTTGSFINPGPGVLISRNSGRSWTHLPFDAEGVSEQTVITALASASGRTIAAGRRDVAVPGLWYAGDPEASWTRVANDAELLRFERFDAAAATTAGFSIAGLVGGEPAVGFSPDALSWTVELLPLTATAQAAARVLVDDMTVTDNGLALVWGMARGEATNGLLWASVDGADWLVFDLGPVVPNGVHVAVADRDIAILTAAADGATYWRTADR